MGWNASGRVTGGNASVPTRRMRKWLVPAALLLACALAGGYALFRLDFGRRLEPSRGKPSDGSKKISVVRPARRQSAPCTNAATFAVAKTNDYWLGVEVDHRKADTNGVLIVETIYTKDGKSHIYYHDTRPNVFQHSTDQVLALATADSPGGAPPLPVVANFEEEFMRSLTTEITIGDEDPPQVREMKERVKAARLEMLAMLEQGTSAEEVLKKAAQQREDDAATRMEAVRLVKQMLDEGDREGAEELCAKYNEALEKMGIMKIELPGTRERKVGEQ